MRLKRTTSETCFPSGARVGRDCNAVKPLSVTPLHKLRPPSTWWLWRDGIAFVAQSCLTTSRTVRRHPRIFTEGLIRHPFAAHDDFIDAVSRIYDIDPQSPVPYDAKSEDLVLDRESAKLAMGQV